MADLANRTVFQEDLDYVEANFYLRISHQSQIIEGGARKALASLFVHGRRGPHPLFGRASFDFDKDKAILLLKDQVNFSARRAEIGHEKFEATSLQVLFGREFAEFTALQMNGTFLAL